MEPGRSGGRGGTGGDGPGPQLQARGRVWVGSPRSNGKRLRAAGSLIEGCSQLSSLLGYETPEKVDGCHGVMYAPPAVKEVYFWERVHTSSIPSA